MACGRRRGSDRRPETCGACVRLGPPPVRVFLGVPHLKAIVVEPKRSPVVRAHAHGHPLVLRNDRSAGVAGLSDALPMPEFDEESSWQSAVLDPLSDYVPEESWMPSLSRSALVRLAVESGGPPPGPQTR